MNGWEKYRLAINWWQREWFTFIIDLIVIMIIYMIEITIMNHDLSK